jgi:S-layer homology domain
MSERRRRGRGRRWIVASVVGFLDLFWARGAAAQPIKAETPVPARRIQPKEFGVQDDTRTVIAGVSFYPEGDDEAGVPYGTLSNLGRYCVGCSSTVAEFDATFDVPAGAVIDFIGVNSATTSDGVLGVALWQRDRFANKTLLVGFSLPAHDWDTDFAGPLGIQVTDHVDKELVLNVEQAPSADYQYFGWVEVWWHRTVSPPPASPSFNDVPVGHPFFQFIEALKASGITGGCGDGTTYCPDSPVTRGQMAVFLAKALGLHWPN